MAGRKAATAGTRTRAGEDGDPGVRPRLLASATDLFNRKGYAGTTVREIVAAAGVTKPVLYYYFRSKEGIFLDLMREAGTRFDAVLDESGRVEGTAPERLKSLAGRTLVFFIAHIDVARLMYAIYYGPPQGAPAFDMDAYHLRFRKVVLRMIEDGIRRGEFRKADPLDMAWAFIGALNVAMELHLCHPEMAFGRERLERVVGLVFAGIGTGRRKGVAR